MDDLDAHAAAVHKLVGCTGCVDPEMLELSADPLPASDVAAQVEAAVEASAIALPTGRRSILEPDGQETTECWGADATGAGLATADAALAAKPER